jgi:ribonucleoside-diphosphate reductase alpha chain
MTYTFDEAFKSSVEYFAGDELAAKVFVDKYALRDNDGLLHEKTPSDMFKRVASEFARIEAKKFKKPLTEQKILGLMENFKYVIPQGSPLFGIGNNFQFVTLSNCYLLDVPEDSYSSILLVDHQLVNISKRRGGVGIDLSNLRPAGAITRNAARTSTGVPSWMERYSNSIREVGQAGRRGALMLTLSIHHPDVLKFATIKNDPTKVTGANISLRLTKEFLAAVEADKDYELCFPVDYKEKGIPPLMTKMIPAREVWKTIINSAWKRAEPGLLMWDNVTENTPADCYEDYKSRGTNPCSEINLSPLDSCRLMVLNLFNYVVDPFTPKAKFDFSLFKTHTKITQRLMDDLVDLESEKINQIIAKIKSDPEPEEIKCEELKLWVRIKKNNDEGRRTGTGITALGDTLAALGIKYGTEESIKMTEEIYKQLKLSAYESSVEMAEELGSFKVYDAEKEKNCPFIKRIAEDDPALYKRMVKSGRRNISLTTTAPVGSISLMTRTSSGVEPLFTLETYTRRKKVNPNDKNARVDFTDAMGDKWQNYTVMHPKAQLWTEVTGNKDLSQSPWAGATSAEISWTARVELQAAAQKHVCHAISSTINLPEEATEAQIAEIYETAFRSGCKGITVYRDKCRDGVMIKEEKAKPEVPYEPSEVKMEQKIIKTHAPKRPNTLKCDVHHIKVTGQEYFVIVGLWADGTPYEIFAGKNGHLPKEVKHGEVIKKKRGEYTFTFEGISKFENVSKHVTDDQEAITRLLSSNLRHGADISFLVQQLEKVNGRMDGFAKALSRALKKYLKDGTKVYGETCGSCGSASIERREGCITCMSCGWSKCG